MRVYLLARQASAGAGLCNDAVNFFPILTFFFFFNDRLEQRDLRNYKPIFTFSAMVDILV